MNPIRESAEFLGWFVARFVCNLAALLMPMMMQESLNCAYAIKFGGWWLLINDSNGAWSRIPIGSFISGRNQILRNRFFVILRLYEGNCLFDKCCWVNTSMVAIRGSIWRRRNGGWRWWWPFLYFPGLMIMWMWIVDLWSEGDRVLFSNLLPVVFIMLQWSPYDLMFWLLYPIDFNIFDICQFVNSFMICGIMLLHQMLS